MGSGSTRWRRRCTSFGSRNALDEGRHWLALAMTHDDPCVPLRTRSRVRSAAGFLALYQHDFSTAVPLIEEGLVLVREVGEPVRLVDALLGPGCSPPIRAITRHPS